MYSGAPVKQVFTNLHNLVVFNDGDDILVVGDLFGQSQQLDFRLF